MEMETSNPESTATLKLSEWCAILDALEEWGYRNDMSGAEARMVRRKLPAEAVAEWQRNKDMPAPTLRTTVWKWWNQLEGHPSRVKRVAADLGIKPETVAQIVYPPEEYGEWDPSSEPDL